MEVTPRKATMRTFGDVLWNLFMALFKRYWCAADTHQRSRCDGR